MYSARSPRDLPSFPTRRSSDLVLSDQPCPRRRLGARRPLGEQLGVALVEPADRVTQPVGREELDRKSTRLNSRHLGISYAVFCSKKYKKQSTTHVHVTHAINND